MNKICIDAKPHDLPKDLLNLLTFLFNSKPTVDLTEGNIYECTPCQCGEHYIVNPDDAGDKETYLKERFADVPDISEINELLKVKICDTYA